MRPRWATGAVFFIWGSRVLKRNHVQWIFPVIASCLLALWFVDRPRQAPAQVHVSAPAAPARELRTERSEPAGSGTIIPGGYVAPKLEDATPSEIEQLREAEVTRSAESPEPPKSFVGADGNRHPFQYNGSAPSSAVEAARDVGRKLLMQQLRADPVGFALTHKLAAKEVQWILDGSEDFPERLLD